VNANGAGAPTSATAAVPAALNLVTSVVWLSGGSPTISFEGSTQAGIAPGTPIVYWVKAPGGDWVDTNWTTIQSDGTFSREFYATIPTGPGTYAVRISAGYASNPIYITEGVQEIEDLGTYSFGVTAALTADYAGQRSINFNGSTQTGLAPGTAITYWVKQGDGGWDPINDTTVATDGTFSRSSFATISRTGDYEVRLTGGSAYDPIATSESFRISVPDLGPQTLVIQAVNVQGRISFDGSTQTGFAEGTAITFWVKPSGGTWNATNFTTLAADGTFSLGGDVDPGPAGTYEVKLTAGYSDAPVLTSNEASVVTDAV